MLQALGVYLTIWPHHVRWCYRYHRRDCGRLASVQLAIIDATGDAWMGFWMNRAMQRYMAEDEATR